jgi:hypothetical protein
MFCYGDVFLQETFHYGDVLLRRRCVYRRFVWIRFVEETFCMCAKNLSTGYENVIVSLFLIYYINIPVYCCSCPISFGFYFSIFLFISQGKRAIFLFFKKRKKRVEIGQIFCNLQKTERRGQRANQSFNFSRLITWIQSQLTFQTTWEISSWTLHV